jgi:beta-glucosidase/6-phospho-beta-glucosidase/beta-galactosidase
VGDGIKPVLTLFHFDLPQKLQDRGGWANRDVTDYFEEYARHVYRELGNSVAHTTCFFPTEKQFGHSGKCASQAKSACRFRSFPFIRRRRTKGHDGGSPIDFLGINNYDGWSVRWKPGSWPLDFEANTIGKDKTDTGWGISPATIRDLLVRTAKEYPGHKIFITENGIACRDIVNRNGIVDDDNRVDYLHQYLIQVQEAIQAGVPVIGYLVWSLLDNFEWSAGLSKRFGLTYVDFDSQNRIIKKSGYWYRDVVKANRVVTQT